MALTLTEVPLDRIVSAASLPEPDRALLESMAQLGLLVAVDLRAQPDGTYQIDEGHRRVAGARRLGWTTIRAVVEPAGEAVHSQDLKAIIINTHRQNLRQLDLARHAHRLLRQSDSTQTQLARLIHISRSSLSRMLKVIQCPDLVTAIEDEGLEFGAAKALAPLRPADRAELLTHLRQIADRDGKFPSVREVEALVSVRQGQDPLPVVPPAHLPALVKELQTVNVPVQIKILRGKQSHLKITVVLDDTDEYWVRAFASNNEGASGDPPSEGAS
jgi:ParB/RepB/Spo0J family partition protein